MPDYTQNFTVKSYGKDMQNKRVQNVGYPQENSDAINLEFIKDLLSANDFQDNVKAIQEDATLVPVRVDGARYILRDVLALHADFGTITGVSNNDIVEYDGSQSKFVVACDVSVHTSKFILAFNEGDEIYYSYSTENDVWSLSRGLIDMQSGYGLKERSDKYFDVDRDIIPSKKKFIIGNDIAYEFDILHNLNTDHVFISVKDTLTQEHIEVSVKETSANSILISFGNKAPAMNSVAVLIIG